VNEDRITIGPWPSDASLPEGFSLTNCLRWNEGILEQMHQGDRGGQKWEPVPTVAYPT
jgi:hypothetical protein